MTWHTEGISVTAPVKWRQLDGLVGAFWEAESQDGAKGYYLAADPRIMIFFNDVSSRITMSNSNGESTDHARPMTRAVYVPAGVPMWTSSSAPIASRISTWHIHKDRLLRFLRPPLVVQRLGSTTPPGRDSGNWSVETLASLLVDELAEPSKHAGLRRKSGRQHCCRSVGYSCLPGDQCERQANAGATEQALLQS